MNESGDKPPGDKPSGRRRGCLRASVSTGLVLVGAGVLLLALAASREGVSAGLLAGGGFLLALFGALALVWAYLIVVVARRHAKRNRINNRDSDEVT